MTRSPLCIGADGLGASGRRPLPYEADNRTGHARKTAGGAAGNDGTSSAKMIHFTPPPRNAAAPASHAVQGAPPARLAEYLERIGYTGRPKPDLETLTELHRRHVDTFTWENLDFILRKKIDRDPEVIFDKLMRQRRGGCCFEQTGLFAWMLQAIGFQVAQLAAGVMREQQGDKALGNHLMLIVTLDRPYVVDVGLGNGLIEPIPLEAGEYKQRYMTFRLEHLGGAWWRLHNQPGLMPPSIDLSPELQDEDLLDEKLDWAQTGADSPFWQIALIHRHSPEGLQTAAGRNRVFLDATGVRKTTVADADFVDMLEGDFRLGPQMSELRPQIEAFLARDLAPPPFA